MTPWTVACQASLPVGFPRQEYWSGFYFLLQGIFPTQGSNPCLLHWQVHSLSLSHQGSLIFMVESIKISIKWKYQTDSVYCNMPEVVNKHTCNLNNADLTGEMIILVSLIKHVLLIFRAFETLLEGLPWWLSGKESTCQCRRHRFDPWSGRIPPAAGQLSLCTTAIELAL